MTAHRQKINHIKTERDINRYRRKMTTPRQESWSHKRRMGMLQRKGGKGNTSTTQIEDGERRGQQRRER